MASYGGSIPKIGSRVITSDGEQLGRVKDVHGECFKVDAPLQADYWLAADSIATTLAGEVMLTFSRDDLGKAKAEGKEHRGIHRHT